MIVAPRLRQPKWLVVLMAVRLMMGTAAGADSPASAPVDPPAEVARRILASPDDPKASQAIDALGGRIAVAPDEAEAVLATLEATPGIEAATLRAELLVWAARGEPAVQKYRPKGTPGPATMTTERVGQLAGALLQHDDPVIRGLAEWAIAIRLGVECEGRRSSPWPNVDECDWFRRWSAIAPASLLELDYVRQAVATGEHRSTAALLRSAESIVARTDALAAWMHLETPEAIELRARSSARLDAARQRLGELAAQHPDDLTAQRRAWLDLRHAARDVVMQCPQLEFRQILFATRMGPDSGNITNGGVRDIYGPGGDLYVKKGLMPEDPAEPLLRGRLGPGHFRGLDLWWDADRLVFSYARQPGYDRTKDAVQENTEMGRSQTPKLFEMNIDGSGLRPLTDATLNADLEPCYLPGGDIVFASDRSFFGSQCAGSLQQDKMILNLYRCAPDGTNVRPLSNNKDFDRHPRMMENGQLLFLRWEYQERHLWQTHTLWTCRPDGSMADAIYKQHIQGGPMSLREARQIPGQSRLVAIACGHHNGEIGAVMLADYSLGINDTAGMRLVTPGASTTEGGYGKRPPVDEGGVRDKGGHYQFPYPLSDKSFLVAYSYKKPESAAGRDYGLYYIDVWGNKELIHRDRRLSVAYLMPVVARKRPPAIPERLGPAAVVAASPLRQATVYVANVDNDMPGVSPGTVKYLRISQKMPWPCVRQDDKACGYNDLHASPSGAWTPMLGIWDWSPARTIGIVPVEKDGSASFRVPVDQTVYFQALDENFLEVRRMRSNVSFQQGEYRGCVGCHESRATAPPPMVDALPLALKRDPSMPVPPPWGAAQLPDYATDIQPIFDRHCVRCHGAESPEGGIELSSRRIDDYMQSYRALFGIKATDPTPVASEDGWRWLYPGKPMPPANKEFFKRVASNQHPGQLVTISDRFGGAEITGPARFGSSQSLLTRTLVEDELHRREAPLSPREWLALVTWIDLNAPYFSTYANKEPTRAGKPAQWVQVRFPDPWLSMPAGMWTWHEDGTVVLGGE